MSLSQLSATGALCEEHMPTAVLYDCGERSFASLADVQAFRENIHVLNPDRNITLYDEVKLLDEDNIEASIARQLELPSASSWYICIS